MNETKKRIWEIDFLRALAVIGMIIFHVYYYLDFEGVKSTNLFADGWDQFGDLIRNTFFLLVGVSLVLSLQRQLKRAKPMREYYLRQAKRAILLILIGLVITGVTILFAPDQIIRFGVLSFIGTSILLVLPVIRYPIGLALMASLVWFIGFQYAEVWTLQSLFGYILGFYPGYLPSLDYFPIFPWLGDIAAGGVLAYIFFKGAERRYKFPDAPKLLKPINWIGKNALLIYVLHMPITVALVALWLQFFN